MLARLYSGGASFNLALHPSGPVRRERREQDVASRMSRKRRPSGSSATMTTASRPPKAVAKPWAPAKRKRAPRPRSIRPAWSVCGWWRAFRRSAVSTNPPRRFQGGCLSRCRTSDRARGLSRHSLAGTLRCARTRAVAEPGTPQGSSACTLYAPYASDATAQPTCWTTVNC